ncbi:MAG: hypothetical protein ACJ72N_13285 [Labedaea sp.]
MVHSRLPSAVRAWTRPAVDAATFEERVRAEMTRPFDLAVEGPLRVRVLTEPDGEYVMVLVLHHIAWDFESIVLALREIGDDYRALPGAPAAECRTGPRLPTALVAARLPRWTGLLRS